MKTLWSSALAAVLLGDLFLQPQDVVQRRRHRPPWPLPLRRKPWVSISATTTAWPTTSSFASYWAKLERESDRLKVVEHRHDARKAGRSSWPSSRRRPTTESSTTTSRSPAGSRWPKGSTEAEARQLAGEGKAVVWIDGGLHASETLCAQALIETLYQFVAANDAETLRILDDVIILFVHANPDGMDLVADWYMREKDPKKRSLDRPAAALPEVHRPRQQPRLLRQHAGRDEEHEPRHVPRVVPADRLQPPPVRPARHGAVLPAVPRPVQLQLSIRWSSAASTPSGRR